MIKRAAAVLLILSVSILQACNNEKNREIFEDFEGEEGIYMIKLPPGLFLNLIEKGSDAETDNLGDVDFVKLLVFDQAKSTNLESDGIVKEIKEKFDKYGFELAVQFNSGSTDISAYMLDNEDYVSDIMILFKEDNSLIGLGLSGKLDGKSLMSFASKIDYDDLVGLSGDGIF